MHLIYRLVTSAKTEEAKISFGGNLLLNILKVVCVWYITITNGGASFSDVSTVQSCQVITVKVTSYLVIMLAIHISLPDSLCRHGERDHYKISRCRALLWCSEIIFHIWPSSSATCSAIWTVKSLLYLNWVAATNN